MANNVVAINPNNASVTTKSALSIAGKYKKFSDITTLPSQPVSTTRPMSAEEIKNKWNNNGETRNHYFNHAKFTPTFYGTTMDELNKSVNLPGDNVNSSYKSFKQTVDFYNRYKVLNPNLILQRGFAHVFFVPPSCNILDEKGNLVSGLQDNPIFKHIYQSTPDVLEEISANRPKHNNDFMMSLSNAVASFPLNDEYIDTTTYGRTFTGYEMQMGRSTIGSKTAGDLSIEFNEDRDLHIYQLHKAWIEYISGVYRGSIAPTDLSIFGKEMDYAGAAYYILTAEDNTTILFWSKYYGIFPTNLPLTQFSYSEGNVIRNLQLSFQYKYMFKEDYDPQIISEFNMNANIGNTANVQYLPNYNPYTGTVGNTWVGTPYIELPDQTKVNTDPSRRHYKLRFMVPKN